MHKNVKLIIALIILTSGCQTMLPVSGTDETALRLSIAVGDTVRVLTKHGDRPTFEVTNITEEAISGTDQTIQFDDMAFLEKRSNAAATGNTLTALLVIVGGAVVFDSLSGLGPPPG